MNVFVLCTGRCGSVTFIESAKHIANYSAGHESRTYEIGSARFAYPPDHVEAVGVTVVVHVECDASRGDPLLPAQRRAEIDAGVDERGGAERAERILAARRRLEKPALHAVAT